MREAGAAGPNVITIDKGISFYILKIPPKLNVSFLLFNINHMDSCQRENPKDLRHTPEDYLSKNLMITTQ